MVQLRQGGVYRVPAAGHLRVVARDTPQAAVWDLLEPSRLVWMPQGQAAYRVDTRTGAVTYHGARCHWGLRDMIDTGLTLELQATGA